MGVTEAHVQFVCAQSGHGEVSLEYRRCSSTIAVEQRNFVRIKVDTIICLDFDAMAVGLNEALTMCGRA